MPSFGQRVALLIGIQQYPRMGSLNTPNHDVALMRRTLEECGFSAENIVSLTSDGSSIVSAAGIRRAVAQFAQMIRAMPTPVDDEQSCAVIYYAGHGVTHRRESYILSDLADLTESEIAAEGIKLDEIVRQVFVRLDIPSLLFIDACQSSSKARSLQLESVCPPGFLAGNMIVDLATCPGEIAFDGVAHSPYATALHMALPVADQSVGDALTLVRAHVRTLSQDRQSPVQISTLSVRLIMNPSRAPANATVIPVAPATLGQARGTGSLGPRRDFSPDEIREMGHLVHKLKANDSAGHRAYYFVLVEPHFEAGFLNAIQRGGDANLENFGVVLASCFGDGPTPEVCRFLWDTYGFRVEPVIPSPVAVGRNEGRTAPMPDLPADPPMLVALRQHTGFGQWRWLVMFVPAQNRMAFAQAADELAALDKGGFGTDGKGLLGTLRRSVDAVGVSLFDIEKLAVFGMVFFRGKGKDVPPRTLDQIRQRFGIVFDWADWEDCNGVIADCR